ncbi:MAG: YraN family protein [Planctomycetaceae bacterium]
MNGLNSRIGAVIRNLAAPLQRIILRRVAGKGSAASHLSLGDRGEQAAVRFLKARGFKILQQQYRNQFGEIDIVGRHAGRIVFVEVKTRTSDERGLPSEAVDRRKQQQLTRLALVWLKKYGKLNQSARFDVVSILWPTDSEIPQIQHIPNAFQPTGFGQFFS